MGEVGMNACEVTLCAGTGAIPAVEQGVTPGET